MQYIDFINTKNLLKILESEEGKIAYKLNKSAFIKLPQNFIDLPRQKLDFARSNICAIFLENNEKCLDCDNIHTYQAIKELFRQNGVQTLCTKSEFGGHIYFESARDFAGVKDTRKQAIINQEHLIYYKESKAINCEVFTSQTRRAIFDGAQNGYYKIDSDTLELANIDNCAELLTTLTELLGAPKSKPYGEQQYEPKESSPTIIAQGRFVSLNRRKYDAAKKWLVNGDIDLFEFKTYYETDTRKYDTEAGNRNNFLLTVLASFGSCGYFESFEELREFIYLVNIRLLKEPLNQRELDKTILNDAKRHKFLYAKDTEQFISANAKEIFDYAQLYIARLLMPKSASHRYQLIDFTKPDDFAITPLISKEARKDVLEQYPSLKQIHADKEDCLPLIQIISNPAEPRLYSKGEQGETLLNLGSFIYNPLINETLERQHANHTPEEFKQTIFYQFLKNNLIPNAHLRAKFLGDLGEHLKTKRYLHQMLIIKDPLGSTGKDFVLSQYLQTIMFGNPPAVNTRIQSHVNTLTRAGIAGSLYATESVSNFLSTRFNAQALQSKLLIFNEDGGAFYPDDFMARMQTILKNPAINIEIKGSEPFQIPNQMFIVRYTNSGKQILPSSATNTRFYISQAQRMIDITSRDVVTKLFGASADVRAKATEEAPIILDYLLYYAPNESDYCGFETMPENATQADQLANVGDLSAEVFNELPSEGDDYSTFERAKKQRIQASFETFLKELQSSTTPPLARAQSLLEAIVPHDKVAINIPLCEYILGAYIDNTALKDLVCVFYNTYTRKARRDFNVSKYLSGEIITESQARQARVRDIVFLVSKTIEEPLNTNAKNKVISYLARNWYREATNGYASQARLVYEGEVAPPNFAEVLSFVKPEGVLDIDIARDELEKDNPLVKPFVRAYQIKEIARNNESVFGLPAQEASLALKDLAQELNTTIKPLRTWLEKQMWLDASLDNIQYNNIATRLFFVYDECLDIERAKDALKQKNPFVLPFIKAYQEAEARDDITPSAFASVAKLDLSKTSLSARALAQAMGVDSAALIRHLNKIKLIDKQDQIHFVKANDPIPF